MITWSLTINPPHLDYLAFTATWSDIPATTISAPQSAQSSHLVQLPTLHPQYPRSAIATSSSSSQSPQWPSPHSWYPSLTRCLLPSAPAPSDCTAAGDRPPLPLEMGTGLGLSRRLGAGTGSASFFRSRPDRSSQWGLYLRRPLLRLGLIDAASFVAGVVITFVTRLFPHLLHLNPSLHHTLVSFTITIVITIARVIWDALTYQYQLHHYLIRLLIHTHTIVTISTTTIIAFISLCCLNCHSCSSSTKFVTEVLHKNYSLCSCSLLIFCYRTISTISAAIAAISSITASSTAVIST